MTMKHILFPISILCTPAANAQVKADLPLLDSMTIAVEKNTYTNIHSILIAKEGELVYERYFNSRSAKRAFDILIKYILTAFPHQPA